MRIAILFIAALLAGCNSSDDDSALQQQVSAIPNEATAVQALKVQVSELQNKFKELTIVGKQSVAKINYESPDSVRMMGTITQAAASISFGPCTNMGVLVGRGSETSLATPDPLSANLEAFQQCTGYSYNTLLGSGTIGTAPRIFWDGPNCTGNLLEWEAAGSGYNTQTLQNGVVFLSPVDGTPLMVKAGQTPQPILIQSAWVLSNPGCQSDVEIQLMYFVTPNDVTITGIPTNVPAVPQLSAP